MNPTRIEDLNIHLELNKSQIDGVEHLITELLGYRPFIEEGDTLKVTYRFSAAYFGEVERRLTSLITLLNARSNCVVQCDSNLLDGTTSLIGTVVVKLFQLKQRLAPLSRTTRFFRWLKSWFTKSEG